MFSGGNYPLPTSTATSSGQVLYDAYGRPVIQGPQTGFPGMTGQAGVVGVQAIPMLPVSTGPQSTFNVDLNPSEAKSDEMVDAQMALNERQQELNEVNSYANIAIAGVNSLLSMGALIVQDNAISAHYAYMNKVADNGMEVALAQVNLQEDALYHEENMQSEQNRHQVELARIEQKTQIKLAKIAEKGKTDRSALYVANNAFSRKDYPYGMTVGR